MIVSILLMSSLSIRVVHLPTLNEDTWFKSCPSWYNLVLWLLCKFFSFKLNRLNGNYALSCHPKNMNFHTLVMGGLVHKVANFSSSYSTTRFHYALADFDEHYNTWIYVSFCCQQRGYKSWFRFFRPFRILPTGANPVHSFVCYFVFPHGHLLLAFIITDHAILWS